MILDFEQWMDQLILVAQNEFGYQHNDFDRDSWKEFYQDGFSPRDALIEDLSNCDD